MKIDRILIARVALTVLAVILLLTAFMPLMSLKKTEYDELSQFGDELDEFKDISFVEYIQNTKAMMAIDTPVYTVTLTAFFVFSGLSAILGFFKKPKSALVSALLSAVPFLMVWFEITDLGIIGSIDSRFEWGYSFRVLAFVLVAFVAVSVWMMVELARKRASTRSIIDDVPDYVPVATPDPKYMPTGDAPADSHTNDSGMAVPDPKYMPKQ